VVSALVFAPSPLLTVTIEQKGSADDIHVHAGGQGFWIARMLAALDVSVTLCGSFGGETGLVVRTLIEREAVTVRGVDVEGGNAAYVDDRRSGTRTRVAQMAAPALSRHEVDALYSAMLVEGLEASVCVLAGTPGHHVLPDDTYGRLARDLRANGRVVVADLSGVQLRSVLDGAPTVLKVSHTELIEGGWATGGSEAELVHAMSDLRAAGTETVIVSRAEQGALVSTGEQLLHVDAPRLEPLDHRGAGDSMTAGVAAGLAHGWSIEPAIRLGAAAGTLNVTRRGLASGEREAIEQLARHVQLRPLELPRARPNPSGGRTTTPEELAARARPAS